MVDFLVFAYIGTRIPAALNGTKFFVRSDNFVGFLTHFSTHVKKAGFFEKSVIFQSFYLFECGFLLIFSTK